MALTPNFAASVTIADLPTGTTVTGAELFEAVQTGSGGFAQSVQLSLSNMVNLGLTVGTALLTTSAAGAIIPYVDVMTSAQYRADTAKKILSTDTTWGAAATVILTDATTVALDFSTFINATLTGTGGVGSTRTLGAATNVKIGQSGVIEWFPVTGATTLVVPTSSSYVSAGGISTLALSTSNGAQDAIIYTVLSTNKVLLAIQKAVAT